MTYTVTLDVPKALWWTSNSRIHPHARARNTRAIRDMACLLARGQRIPTMPRVRIVAHVSYPRAGRADPANVVGTVVKAAVDGLVDAGVLPDDDSRHVIGPDPRRGPDTRTPGLWRVRLELIPEES